MRPTAVTITCLMAFLVVGPASGQRVTATLSLDSVAIGERFVLTLYAQHDFDAPAAFPALDSADSTFGDLVVTGAREQGSRSIVGGRLDSIMYDVTSFALNTAHIPSLPVSFGNGAATDSTPSLTIPMISVLPPNATDIRDIADLAVFNRPIWLYVVVGIAILVGIILVIYFIRRSRQTLTLVDQGTPGPSPYIVATETLLRLAKAPPRHIVEVKPYHINVSTALRTYFESVLNVPAMEQTTSELLRAFVRPAVRHLVPGPVPSRTRDVLELADLVKFADYFPDPSCHSQCAESALEIVTLVQTKIDQISNKSEE